jgi:gas vesicle protein
MNRIGNFILGALLGGMVGAITALILAPSSGQQLRSDIVTRADQIRSEVTQAAATRRAELERQLAELRAPQKTGQY